MKFLQERLGLQFSTIRPGVEQNRYFVEGIRHVCNRGREAKVWGVKNNGICLLIAYIGEIIQQGLYDYDSQKFYGQPG